MRSEGILDLLLCWVAERRILILKSSVNARSSLDRRFGATREFGFHSHVTTGFLYKPMGQEMH